jgi:hypothetical protein
MRVKRSRQRSGLKQEGFAHDGASPVTAFALFRRKLKVPEPVSIGRTQQVVVDVETLVLLETSRTE